MAVPTSESYSWRLDSPPSVAFLLKLVQWLGSYLRRDGRMMSVVCDGRREHPAGLSREYSSYCGNYSFDGTRLITKVETASDPNRIGSDQVRGVRFDVGPGARGARRPARPSLG